MKFGKVDDPGNVDFTLPPDHPQTKEVLNRYEEGKFENVRIGCAKWNRQDLKNFYPRGTKDELSYYATQFNAIELNASFYRIFPDAQFETWYGKATEDFQWIHIDEDKAKEGPFGSTIAHGFLTLSLAPWMGYNTYKVKNIAHSVNYGLDRVRFLSPVKADSKVRGSYKLLEVQEFKGNGYRVKNELTIEIQNKERPACVAETIAVLYPED